MRTIILKCQNPECFYHSVELKAPEDSFSECPLCHSAMIPAAGKNWLVEIAEDEGYWIRGADDSYPSVLAYEYRRLQDFCRNGNAYAAVFSLKDNFESLLKYFVLLSYAWAAVTVKDGAFPTRALAPITRENLSFGSWVKLTHALMTELVGTGFSLPPVFPLDRLAGFYQEAGIVTWRNEKVAHGAMQLEDDTGFRNDIREILLNLKNAYSLVDQELRQHELWLVPDDIAGKEIKLNGSQSARGLPCCGRIQFRTAEGMLSFSADPYIVVREHTRRGYGVYFFDNQKPANRSHFLAYPDGGTVIEPNPYFEQLRRSLKESGAWLDVGADSQYLTESQVKELDIQQMSHGFVKPEYLIQWLGGCISRHEKGVFLLQMERGTGKSTFTERISGLSEKPVTVSDGLDIRTYHISRSQFAGIWDATSYIEYMWSSNLPRMPHISDYEKEGMGLKPAFCAFLGASLRVSRERGYGRIMMVFDGLDEINNRMLWEMIPEEGDLPDGVYILLTSRIPGKEDLPGDIGSRICGLPVTEKEEYSRDGDNNQRFLREYIKRTKVGKLNKEGQEKLITLSDSRILYLGLYCRLLEAGLPFGNLPMSGMAVKTYLEVIEDRYGEKEALRLRELIAVLATLGSLESLSLKAIGGLLPEGGITLRLAAMVRDISPLIKVQRGEEGNLYSIANPYLAKELARQIRETEDVVRSLVQLAMAAMQDGQPGDTSEEIMIAHVAELALGWLPEKEKAMGKDADEIISQYITQAEKQASNFHIWPRLLDYQRQLFLFRFNALEADDPRIVEAQHAIAITLTLMGSFANALKIYEEAYNANSRILGKEHPYSLALRADMAETLNYLGQNEEALSIQKEVYEALCRTQGKEHLNTLIALKNISALLTYLDRNEEALSIQKEVYEALCRTQGKEHPDALKARGNIAQILSNMEQYEEALSIQKEVYEVLCRTQGKEHPDALKTRGNIAQILSNMEQYEEALSIYAEVYETLCRIEKGVNNVTLEVRDNMAKILSHIGQTEDAHEIYKEVYEGYCMYLGKKHPYSLAARRNIAISLENMKHFEEALYIYNEVYEAQCRIIGQEDWDTLMTRQNILLVLKKLNRYEEALSICTEIYETLCKIQGKEHPNTLRVRGHIPEILEFMGHLDRAIAIWHDIYEAKCRVLGEDNPETMNVLFSIVMTLDIHNRYDEALAIVREEQKVYETRSRDLGKEHPKTLAIREHAAHLLMCLKRYDEALEEYVEVYATRCRAQGKKHSDTLRTCRSIALLLEFMGRYDEARAIELKCELPWYMVPFQDLD